MFAAIILGGRRERWSKEENLKKASAERLPWVEAAGARIPTVGCGTWELRGETCAAIVSQALTIGYRHIDTAQGYDNERAVGEGIHRAAIRREELFVTTKVRPQFVSDGALQTSAEESLARLGLDYIDLLLLHWPNPAVSTQEMMTALSDAKRRGLTRNIGVSNFTTSRLEEAITVSPEPIAANQIEYHPYLDQTKLIRAIRRHGIAVIAYCPIALGHVSADPVLRSIGKERDKTAAQVALRWLIQQEGVCAIPRTSKSRRLKENLDVFNFALSEEEMNRIDQLTRPNSRLINEPGWVPIWD